MNEPEHDAEREAERAQRRAEHETEREQRRAERDVEREGRRAEREARRTERDRIRAEFRTGLGHDIGDEIRHEINAGMHGMHKSRKWYFGIGDLGLGAQGGRAEASEVIEHRFQVSGMPRVHVNNVSGETEITVGTSGEVFVRARKRVHGWSEERARRLLENVEIRLDQEGDDIVIEPRLFQQERGWLELFRGGRVAVDLDIRVPRETQVEAVTVSGELSLTGTRGPAELRSVSGDVSLSDVQGPIRLRSVSGDVTATGYAGQVEANSVSGEIEFERSRVRDPDVVTVSGDVSIDSLFATAGGGESRVKSVSGDIELALGEADAEIDFKTVSGDAEAEGPAHVEKVGRRDRRIVIGRGGAHLRVKTVSGDLNVRTSREVPVEAERASDAEGEAIPMGAPAPPAEPARSAAAREILARVARGELSVDAAAAALDEARGSR
jgi:DUF4097 and DUF4098 domain-containing protein YvlB